MAEWDVQAQLSSLAREFREFTSIEPSPCCSLARRGGRMPHTLRACRFCFSVGPDGDVRPVEHTRDCRCCWTVYAGAFIGRSWIIIQLMPNRSRNWPNLVAKNVSCIGMNTSPPSERAEKMRSASASLSTPKDR